MVLAGKLLRKWLLVAEHERSPLSGHVCTAESGVLPGIKENKEKVLWCACTAGGGATMLAGRLLWDRVLVAGRERSPFFAEHLRSHPRAPARPAHNAPSPTRVPGPVPERAQQRREGAGAHRGGERARWDWPTAAAALVAGAGQRLLGRALLPDEPFMSAGLDSLGGLCTSPSPAQG